MTDDIKQSADNDEEAATAAEQSAEETTEDVAPLHPDVDNVVTALRAAFEDLNPEPKDDGWIDLVVPAESLTDVAKKLQSDPNLGFDYLSMISAVDYQDDGFQVVYHLLSLMANKKLVVKVNLPDRDNPVVPTVIDVWPTAAFHEREAYDMMGIQFEGHPNLRRILMRQDWVGYPLRKDYVDERAPRERLTKESYIEDLASNRQVQEEDVT